MALICLTTARTPFVASAWLTVAVGLKAFSHCGFLVNLQVNIFSASSFIMFLNIWLIVFLCQQEIAPQYAGVLHGKFASVYTWIFNWLFISSSYDYSDYSNQVKL